MQADIAIVVAAFNRPQALQRLLASLQQADYNGYQNISLIISIDHSGKDDCNTIADFFKWQFGEKKIIRHSQNLGLKHHIISCGDFSQYYDAVIVLEDDLYVAPSFYDYSQQAYQFFKNENTVGGIALYNYKFNEVAFCPFDPIADGFDNYFLKVPCSSGQLWTKKQWQFFKDFISNNQVETTFNKLPPAVRLWPSNSSWKKFFYAYLSETNRYFVYPRIGLTTNFGDIGQHHENAMSVWQTPLIIQRQSFHFSTFNESASIYDLFFELEDSIFKRFGITNGDITIDLNGSKPLNNVHTQFLLSSKECKKPIKKFALELYPYENNILFKLEEDSINQNFISLGLTSTFTAELNVDRRVIDVHRVFFNAGQLTEAGRNEVYASKEYKVGKLLLQPFQFLKRLLRINK